ncbi:MAG TPA: acyl-CoA dehydrogenase family protein [Sandaracinaceae bacterium LLY-WYZ-13_1]|nr:acyl-CoA dehydrogenase family protein [Sandaracinaceae bacterium LLY-WYZ-13_1]
MPNRLLEGSLRLLNAFAGSELAERYGLHEPAEQWLQRGTKLGAELLSRAAARARRAASAPTEPGARFDLTPTEDQELVRSTMRRFAEEALRPAAEAADDALALPAEVTAQAAELGLGLLAVPEAYGGAAEARSPVTWALIAEELARGDLGLAWGLLASPSAAHLVLDHGTEAQRERWLPAFGGDAFVPAAPALLERRPLFDPRAPTTRAARKGGGYRLRGAKALVPLGRSARFFLVSATVRDEGPRLFVVERDRPGLTIESEPAMGLRAADPCSLSLDDVEVGPEAKLGDEGFDHQRVVDLARVGWAALTVGQGQAVLEYAIAYGNDRVAFGEPITNRQSVAFLIADLAIELEGLRLMTWRAADRAERGRPFTGEAHLSRAQSARVGTRVGTDGVQVLGGAGFVREHPVERWYRHLRTAGVMEGGVCP